MFRTSSSFALLAAVLLVTACAQGFRPQQYQSIDELYAASLQQLERRNWENAVNGFERLTFMMPARHPLLPSAHFHLARSYQGRREHLLAAQSYLRVPELFPNDTLADDALFRAAQSYSRLWRRPDLDGQYGEIAIGTYATLLENYPASGHRAEAEREIARLRQALATKLYETGRFYFRRRGFDPAIIYFNAVVDEYPDTPRARDALFSLVESYRRINYREEAAEACEQLHRQYPGDAEVRQACGPPPAASAEQPSPPSGMR